MTMATGTPFDDGTVPPVPHIELQRRPHRRRAIWIGASIAVLVALAAATVVVSAAGSDEVDAGSQPTAWDNRVRDLVEFVEETRGLTFERPVAIEFLSEEAFDEKLATSSADVSKEDRRKIEASEAAFRALGLIDHDVDLAQELDTLSAGDVAAFYDSEQERVFIPQGEMTPMLGATLVHELTHALQDQHFDLDRLGDDARSDEASAFQALVEGDAERIEQAYVEAMSPADAALYKEEQSKSSHDATDAIAHVPTVLTSMFESPYLLGDGLIRTLVANGGQDRIDEAFEHPPVDEEQLLEPLTFLEGDAPIDAPTPEVDGTSVIESGDFGAISWYLLLAMRLDPRTALEAVEGWGGDAYVVYDNGSGTCVQAVFEGDNVGQAVQMEVALRDWTGRTPGGSADVRRDDAIVTLVSCDDGSSSSDAANLPAQALVLPYLRTLVEVEVLKAGGTTGVARCSANLIIESLSEESVQAMTNGGRPAAIWSEISELAPSSVKTCMASAPA
jgi:hypothetical protein